MIYILLVNSEIMPTAYTSLKGLFDDNKLSYNNSSRKKPLLYVKGVKYEIKTLMLSKIKGRGKRFR